MKKLNVIFAVALLICATAGTVIAGSFKNITSSDLATFFSLLRNKPNNYSRVKILKTLQNLQVPDDMLTHYKLSAAFEVTDTDRAPSLWAALAAETSPSLDEVGNIILVGGERGSISDGEVERFMEMLYEKSQPVAHTEPAEFLDDSDSVDASVVDVRAVISRYYASGSITLALYNILMRQSTIAAIMAKLSTALSFNQIDTRIAQQLVREIMAMGQ